jgi:hypothetical protein
MQRSDLLGDKPVHQQRIYFLARQRSCEVVALGEVAAHLPEMLQLLGVLYPLPHDLEP